MLIVYYYRFQATLHLLKSCFWELAKNVDVQTELITEIESIAKINNSASTTHDCIQSMKYLHMFVIETLRKYPSLPFVVRICNKDCTLPAIDGEMFKFVKGDLIHIPLKLIQNDAKYFLNPEKFNPFRFAENLQLKKFLGFGLGPRKCFGKQFVLLQVKSFLVTVLNEFSVEIFNKSDVILKNDKKLAFVQRNCDKINQK